MIDIRLLLKCIEKYIFKIYYFILLNIERNQGQL